MAAIEAVREAIVTRFDATAGLSAIATNGGLYFGRVPAGTALPYARYADMPLNNPVLPYGTTSIIYPAVFQFDVWNTDRAAVVGYVEALIGAFNRQSLTLTSGGCRMVVIQGNPVFSVEPEKTKDDRDIYRGRVSFAFWVTT